MQFTEQDVRDWLAVQDLECELSGDCPNSLRDYYDGYTGAQTAADLAQIARGIVLQRHSPRVCLELYRQDKIPDDALSPWVSVGNDAEYGHVLLPERPIVGTPTTALLGNLLKLYLPPIQVVAYHLRGDEVASQTTYHFDKPGE